MPRWLIVISALLLGWSGEAVAQTWPSKPIRAIVAFAAGSATDVIPRVVFEPLSAQLGQPIVVENRGGAGTTIGAAMVAKAEPDGYTLLATSSAHTLVPTVYPNASYDTAADFAAVVSLGSSPNVLVVSPSKGFKTAQDLVAAAKARPGSFNFASAGVGSATHLSAERFRMAAGFDATHIPFRGGAEALTEVLSGRAEFYFCPLGTALPQVREGKLMALAVSGPKRAALLPDVPSVLRTISQFRLPVLDRHFHAGEDAARYRREAPSRGGEHDAAPERQSAFGNAGHGPDAADAGRVRCACAGGNWHHRRARQGGGTQAKSMIRARSWSRSRRRPWPSGC